MRQIRIQIRLVLLKRQVTPPPKGQAAGMGQTSLCSVRGRAVVVILTLMPAGRAVKVASQSVVRRLSAGSLVVALLLLAVLSVRPHSGSPASAGGAGVASGRALLCGNHAQPLLLGRHSAQPTGERWLFRRSRQAKHAAEHQGRCPPPARCSRLIRWRAASWHLLRLPSGSGRSSRCNSSRNVVGFSMRFTKSQCKK